MIKIIIHLLTRYMGWFFDHFQIQWDQKLLEDAFKKGPVIFCFSNGGMIESFILRRILLKSGFPELGSSQASSTTALQFIHDLTNNRPVLIWVGEGEPRSAEEETWSERFLNIVQKHPKLHGNVTVIPLLLLWQRAPDLGKRSLRRIFFGSRVNPNLIAKILMMVRRNSSAMIRNAPPVTIQEFFGSSQHHRNPARALRRKIVISIIEERKVLLGPMYYTPAFVRDAIFQDKDLRSLIERLAQEEAVPAADVYHRAGNLLSEIASQQNYYLLEVLFRFFNWYWQKKFRNIYVNDDQLTKIRELNKSKPVVFIPCHRTHLDYLLICYVLLSRKMASPHIAAGINLNFWPVGRILRLAGAYYIRRSFRGDRLYGDILRRYVKFLFDRGFTQLFFIEGGRSRTGKLLSPKYGMIKMFVEAYKNSVHDDLLFVPVAITYDQIPEQDSYQKEALGQKKKSESVTSLLGARKAMKKNLGSCYVFFGDPVSIKESRQHLGDYDGMNPDNRLTFIQKLSFRILHRINRKVVITPTGLVGIVLLRNDKTALSREELIKECQLLLNYCLLPKALQEVPVADNLLHAPKETLEQAIDQLLSANGLKEQDGLLTANTSKILTLSLSKNNIIHHFLVPGIASLTRLFHPNSKEQAFEEALILRDRLKFEFFFSRTEKFQTEFNQEWKTLEDSNLLSESAGYFLRSPLRFLFESYRLVFSEVAKIKEHVPEDDFINLIRVSGRQSLLKGEIQCTEALSDFYYKNAISLAENLGLIERQLMDGRKYSYVVKAQTQQIQEELDRFNHWEKNS